ncbi:MAG: hypothetical protein IPG48_17555 [Saprospiraceae bacterium]|nr:hypothetical protein [Saprospiraceae bacterium]MBK8827559.1 hypothetical protein [Saprospiraceae bacterium]
MIRQHLKLILSTSIKSAFDQFIKSVKQIKVWFTASAGSFFSTNNNLVQKDIFSWWPLFENNYYNFFFVIIFVALIIYIYYLIKALIIESWRRWILIKRESVYGNAIVLLSQAYSKIHINYGKHLSEGETKLILQEICNKIKEIFDYKTQSKTSVSIKVVTEFKEGDQGINHKSTVANLARDKDSITRDTPNYGAIKHTIAKNTCYSHIITNFFSGNRQDKLYFLKNDLPGEDGYDNSSFELFPTFTEEIRKDKKKRRDLWPLSYRSELVIPISHIETTENDNLAILGFICIDCRLEGKPVFNEEYDMPMIKGVCDGLYEFIKLNIFSDATRDTSVN